MKYSLWIAARVGAVLPRHIENAAREYETFEAAEKAADRVRKNPNVAQVGIEHKRAAKWEVDVRILPGSADPDYRVIDSDTGAVIAVIDPAGVLTRGMALDIAKRIAAAAPL